MSLRVVLFLGCLAGHSCGEHHKRQLGSFWYDHVLPSGSSGHQLQDHTAVIITPQYQEPLPVNQYRRVEPEQVAMVGRVYPVLIQFLTPLPVEQSPHLEPQYQLSLEPIPEYQKQHENNSKVSNSQQTARHHNETGSLQFGTRVTTTQRPFYQPTAKPFTLQATTPNSE